MLDLNEEEELCPIALASYLFGDKWIPVIIRDIALFDRRTFNGLLKIILKKYHQAPCLLVCRGCVN